jgi:putative (di)nucleoside polyphosphate hydrolase
MALHLPRRLPKPQQTHDHNQDNRNNENRMTTNHRVNGLKYQPNVAAILRRPDGKIFVGERLTISNAWQFPQGGVDPGESHEQALLRELWEEIGVRPEDYRVVEKRGPYYYLFPAGIVKKGHQGKEQYYFLCDYHGSDAHISVEQEHPEFRAWRWIEPKEFQISWLPEMKREVYRIVFRDFFGLTI